MLEAFDVMIDKLFVKFCFFIEIIDIAANSFIGTSGFCGCGLWASMPAFCVCAITITITFGVALSDSDLFVYLAG